jgi:hypothetical protein
MTQAISTPFIRVMACRSVSPLVHETKCPWTFFTWQSQTRAELTSEITNNQQTNNQTTNQTNNQPTNKQTTNQTTNQIHLYLVEELAEWQLNRVLRMLNQKAHIASTAHEARTTREKKNATKQKNKKKG